MVFIKKGIAKRKRPEPKEFLTVTEQEVKKALRSIEKRSGGDIPSLADVQAELEKLGLRSLPFSRISVTISRLEECGHVRRSLEVVA